MISYKWEVSDWISIISQIGDSFDVISLQVLTKKKKKNWKGISKLTTSNPPHTTPPPPYPTPKTQKIAANLNLTWKNI